MEEKLTRTSLDGTCPMHFMAAMGLLRLAPRARGAWGADKLLRVSVDIDEKAISSQMVKEGDQLKAWIEVVEDANQDRPKKDKSEVSRSTLRLAEQDADLLDLDTAPPPMIALQHPSWTDGDKLRQSHWVFTAGNQKFLPTIACDMSSATAADVRALLDGVDKPRKGAAIWDYERQTLARARSTNDSAKWRRPMLDALAFAGLPTWPVHVPLGPAGWTRRRELWFEWALWHGALPYAAAALCVKSLLGERWTARRARPKGYYRYFGHPRGALSSPARPGVR